MTRRSLIEQSLTSVSSVSEIARRLVESLEEYSEFKTHNKITALAANLGLETEPLSLLDKNSIDTVSEILTVLQAKIKELELQLDNADAIIAKYEEGIPDIDVDSIQRLRKSLEEHVNKLAASADIDLLYDAAFFEKLHPQVRVEYAIVLSDFLESKNLYVPHLYQHIIMSNGNI